MIKRTKTKEVMLEMVNDMTGQVENIMYCQNEDIAWDFIREEYLHDRFWQFA